MTRTRRSSLLAGDYQECPECHAPAPQVGLRRSTTGLWIVYRCILGHSFDTRQTLPFLIACALRRDSRMTVEERAARDAVPKPPHYYCNHPWECEVTGITDEDW